jgi:hypothetical protein
MAGFISRFQANTGVEQIVMQRIAANIAKPPELLRRLTMFFGLKDVKSDDVISLLSRGEPPIPQSCPPDMSPRIRHGTPTVPDLFLHRLGLGHLNVSDTNFPIGLCRAGWVSGCPGLMGRGSLGYLPGRGFRLLIANCSNGHRTGNNHWLNHRCSVRRGASHC